MAVDLFMFFGPAAGALSGVDLTIKGESTATIAMPPGLPSAATTSNTAVAVLGYSFGIQNKTTIGSATGGAGAGKASFNPLTVIKRVDSSSPKLMQACALGSHYKFVNLVIRTSGGGAKGGGTPYLVFNFGMVFITSLDYGTGTPDDINQYGEDMLERVNFAYGAFQINYYKQKSDGVLENKPIQGSWSQITNKADITETLNQ